MTRLVSQIMSFLKNDLWKIRLEQRPAMKAFFVKQLRVVVLAVRGFDEDKCSLKASAMTFYTLLSIVPVAAMMFAVAKGFGFETLLQNQLLQRIPAQEEVIREVISFAHSLLENTRGGLIAGIGVAILFWTVIKLLGNIEYAFNDIWGVQQARSLGRKFSDYLSALLICPLLFIMASSITVAVTSRVTFFVEKINVLSMVSTPILAGLKLLPYCVIWVLFTFLYVFMPNTRVKPGSAILAGIVAGTLYQIVQWGYITFQVGVARYNAIYGGFAALPLFLIWLEISWLIVLFGAEISFAHQNVHTYEFEPECRRVSRSFKNLLSLRILHMVVKRFQSSPEPLTTEDMLGELETPVRLLNQVLDELVTCGLVHEVRTGDERQYGYQPAVNPDSLTIQSVLRTLERHGTDGVPLARTPVLADLERRLEQFDELVAQSEDNVLLRDI